jgi:hypothetical protein
MTKYWITIGEPDKNWDQTKQMSFHAESWYQATIITSAVAEMYNATIRLCKTEGYNNQGYYFNETWYE